MHFELNLPPQKQNRFIQRELKFSSFPFKFQEKVDDAYCLNEGVDTGKNQTASIICSSVIH